jgi:tRNA threonylcarbamoyladenosine biosynthesis protein TsaE
MSLSSFTITSRGPGQTGQIAGVLARRLAAGDAVLLTGPLAAGKTTFVKAVVAALGSTDLVTSPTFTLAQFYATPGAAVLHIDAYRLDDLAEFRDLGLAEFAETAISLVEWGEKVRSEFPCQLVIELRPGDDPEHRSIRLASGCPRWRGILAELHQDMLAAVP